MTNQDANRARAARLTVFFTVAIVLVLTVAATFMMGNAVVSSNHAVMQQQAVIDHLKDALSTVKDAETGQRGYLLTGEDKYLEPYHVALSQIHAQLAELDTLVISEDLIASDVVRLKRLTTTKLAELEETIRLRRNHELNAAMELVHTDSGRQTMDQLRSLAEAMVKTESQELSDRQQTALKLTFWRTFLFGATTLLNLALLTWAYRRINREMTGREAAARQVLEQKELLAVTLASIGDGVIVTESQARITFMNEMAERLTGWTASEAIGTSCTKIFNIINESTRLLVESPVEKVLKNGVVVGLANHTLLIRKDQSEIPIDDSGAPVRDRDGNIQGVVLVFRDFSDHKRSELELIRAKEAAEEANIAKDNFLATLSHELRTPLTPVLATLTAWETGGGCPAPFVPDVQMMRRNIDLEARLIDDLLDLTRIVRGKLSLNPEVADVHELMSSVASMYQSEIQTKKLQLTLQLDAKKHHVFADPARLQQVFWNILKNATKFTNQGGKIEISTRNEPDGQVVASFRDDGIGITQDLLGRLFLPFEQGTHETVRRYGGLGLGLAISKALMDAQGGSIAAESAGPGTGCRFTIGLPCVNAPDCKDVPSVSTEKPSRSLSILLVEDHADTARVMSRLLSSNGHKVQISDTVASALKIAGTNNLDMIISDIGLPDGTGIELIQEVRRHSKIPAIALTGFGMEEDVAKCLEAGFNDHLTKPVNLQKLELVIRNLASRQSPSPI
jgi:PAS domain S-box-containing protein